MKHARSDYNRIQEPALEAPELLAPGTTAIGADEPVILFRARDENFIRVLQFYRELTAESAPDIAEKLTEHILTAGVWQHENGSKTPDLPYYPKDAIG